MRPRSHQQALRRLFDLAQRDVVLARRARIRIVPTAEIERRHVGMLLVVFVDGIAALLPILTIVALRQNIERPLLVGWQEAQRCRAFFQRRASHILLDVLERII